ncbi:MAG: hypothetical protein IPK26_17935 [Planctomycetes bacterium]|nr:hypothetical protein [Planctomycetota bacterium]
MLRLLPCLTLILFASAQDPVPAKEPPPRVTVPTFANATCPRMGKATSTKLFVDTDYGRIFLCCKPCVKDVKADPKAAYDAAYPRLEKHPNTVCPVTGKPTDDKSPRVTLQGHEFAIADAGAQKTAIAESQLVLARLLDPKLVDLRNALCPVTGEPTAPNAFCVVDGIIVRLATPRAVDRVGKEPAVMLQRAAASKKLADGPGNGDAKK